MKKLAFIFILVFTLASLTSCGSKKGGCGLTADASHLPSQEILTAEVAE